jgi:hypothetical protein
MIKIKKITGTAHVWEVQSLATSPPKVPKEPEKPDQSFARPSGTAFAICRVMLLYRSKGGSYGHASRFTVVDWGR